MATAGFWTGSLSYTDSYGNYNYIPLGEVDSDGIAWYWVSLTGWDGAPTVGSVNQQTSDHGGWVSPQYYGPRTLTLSLFAMAPDQATRDLARSKLQAAVPVNDLCMFTYNEPIPKQSQVRRSGPVAETYSTLSEVAFSIPLVAPDPRKYKTTQRTLLINTLQTFTGGWVLPFTTPLGTPAGSSGSNSVTLPNSGDFETRPVVYVSGPCAAPSLTSTKTGQTVSFSQTSLNSTDTLEVDFYNRISRKNGNIVLADVTSAWWVIPPGGTDMIYGGTFTGSSTATAKYSDSWQ